MTDIPISKLITGYLLTTVVFFAIDILWLGVIAKGLYNKMLGHLMATNVNWTAAIIFYLIFIVGIFVFSIVPGIQKESFQYALIYGVLFGFFTYATFDLTSLATLRDWPIKIVFIDIVWGMVLTGSVASSGYLIMKWLLK